MEAQDTSSAIKKGSTVMFVMGVYILVMSVMWFLMTEVVFVSDFMGYTGQSYADYLSTATAYAEIYIITKKLVGLVLAVVGVLIIGVTRSGYSRGERWSWYLLFVAGAMLWGTLIGYRVYIGYVAPSIISFVIPAVLWIIGIALPARDMLGSKSTRQ